MDKKEFLDISREYFKSLGFQTLKKNKFYFESNEYILQIMLTHSNFSSLYYIDYWISVKKLHPNLTISNIEDCVDAIGRFGDGNFQIEIKYENVTKQEYIKILTAETHSRIEPILNKGVKEILNISGLIIIQKETEKFLKRLKC